MHRALLLFILLSCSGTSQKISKEDIKFKQLDSVSKWYLIRNNKGKWGYVDEGLNIKIPLRYDEAGIFSDNGRAFVKENNKYGYYDLKGNIVIPIKYSSGWYFQDNGLAPVCIEKNKCGFIDKDGKELISTIYNDTKLGQLDNIVAVKNNLNWAFFDNTGKQLTDFIFDNVYTNYKQVKNKEKDTFFENGAVLVLRKRKYEFLNKKFRPAFTEYQYDLATPFDTNGNAVVKRQGKLGVINLLGKIILPFEKDFIEPFEKYDTGKIDSYKSKSKGFIEIYDSSFNSFIKTKDRDITSYFFETDNKRKRAYIFRDQNNKKGAISKDREVIIPFEYDELTKIENEKLLIAIKNGKYGLIDESGHLKIPFNYNNLYSFDGSGDQILFIADEKKIINLKNRAVLDGYETIQPIYYNAKKIIVSKNKKFGVIDVNNKILLPLEYDEITNWVEYGPEERHFIMKNGQYGLVEFETFKIIIPPIYDKFMLRQNLIFASHNGKSGILDINNKEICPFVFDEIKPDKSFGYRDSNGKIFYSKKGNKFFEITLKGKIIKEISQKEYKNNTEYQNM